MNNSNVTNREYLKQKVSDLLLEFKASHNITYQELAALLETSYLQVNRWVKKKSLPGPAKLQGICEKLGVDYHSFLGGGSTLLDKITLQSVVDHYELQTQDPAEQRKLLLLATALVFNYLHSRDVSPTMMLRASSDSADFFSDPSVHELQALYTSPVLDNLTLFGNSEHIKFKFLDSSDSPLTLDKDSFVNAVNRQLIHKNLVQ